MAIGYPLYNEERHPAPKKADATGARCFTGQSACRFAILAFIPFSVYPAYSLSIYQQGFN
jgi:hypothetical protein